MSAPPAPDRTAPILAAPSRAVLALCLLAALAHLLPFALAALRTPEGFHFSGNVRVSPDFMQYRIWMRRSQVTGVLVDNTFTAEPNPPHLPVVAYWALGGVAGATGLAPELVFEAAGCVLAFALTWLLWCTVRGFAGRPSARRWALAAILLGGGLGAHLKLLARFEWFHTNPLTRGTLLRAFDDFPFLEEYRGPYVLQTLLDTHFLVAWTSTLASVLAAFALLRRPTPGRWAGTLALFALATLLHVYDGMALVAIAGGVAFVVWRRGLPARTALLLAVAGSAVVAAVLGGQALLWRRAGLPLPPWTELPILFSDVVIGYPLAAVLLAWGGAGLWRRAGLRECFLLGWALGLAAMMLGAPFFPYPTRGAVTLSVPLALLAARVYFAGRERPPLVHAALAAALLFALPLHVLDNWRDALRFDPAKSHIWLSTHQRALVDHLRAHAEPGDLLLVDHARPTWETDDRWLAPEYPGRLWCGHFFLTVDYEAKRERVVAFYREPDPGRRAAFLRESGVRWVFAGPEHDLERLRATPGLELRLAYPEGALLESVHAARPGGATPPPDPLPRGAAPSPGPAAAPPTPGAGVAGAVASGAVPHRPGTSPCASPS